MVGAPHVGPVWSLEDALAGRCDVALVGTPRLELVDALPLDDVQAMARQLAPEALRALLRLAQAGGRGATEAARLLLAYAYGPPPATSTVPAQTPVSGETTLVPSWVPDMSLRLGYQARRPGWRSGYSLRCEYSLTSEKLVLTHMTCDEMLRRGWAWRQGTPLQLRLGRSRKISRQTGVSNSQ